MKLTVNGYRHKMMAIKEHFEDFTEWFNLQFKEGTTDVFLVEFREKNMTVHEFKRNAAGNRYVEKGATEAAKQQKIVPYLSPPPIFLAYYCED